MSPKLNIYDPVKIRDGVYYSKIMIDEGDTSIQVKKNNLTIDKDTNKAILDLDSEAAQYINWVSNEVIKETSAMSKSWFGKEISLEDCETIYKNAMVDGEKLHCFYDENTSFYEKKNVEIDHSELSIINSGIALIKCVVVIFTKKSFFIRWEVLQFKIKHNKLLEKITEYSIRDLEEHGVSFDLEGIEDKIKDISLF